MTSAPAGWGQCRQWGLWGCHRACDHLGSLQSSADPMQMLSTVFDEHLTRFWFSDVMKISAFCCCSDQSQRDRTGINLLTCLGFIVWKLIAGFHWLLFSFFFLAAWLLDMMLVTESWKECGELGHWTAPLLVSLFAQGFYCLQRNLEGKCSWLDCGINPGWARWAQAKFGSSALSNRSGTTGEGGEQGWKAAHTSTYSLDGVFPLPLLLNLSSASTGH